MTVWAFLYRAGPGWPNERQWLMIGLFALAFGMLAMAERNPGLWEVKLFEVLIQGLFLTALFNMVTAFHYAANKAASDRDDRATENTGQALRTIEAVATANKKEDETDALA